MIRDFLAKNTTQVSYVQLLIVYVYSFCFHSTLSLANTLSVYQSFCAAISLLLLSFSRFFLGFSIAPSLWSVP